MKRRNRFNTYLENEIMRSCENIHSNEMGFHVFLSNNMFCKFLNFKKATGWKPGSFM